MAWRDTAAMNLVGFDQLIQRRPLLPEEQVVRYQGVVNLTPEDPGDLSALARASDQAGHGQDAIAVERIALRYHYLAGQADAVAASHDNLGNYLARHAADYSRALGNHLAAALLLSLAGSAAARHSLVSVARDLAQLPGSAVVPATVSDLSASVGEVPGVHLDQLLAELNGDPAAIQEMLDALLGEARTWADPDTPLARHLASWDPVIAGIIAARTGDEQARLAVEQRLAECTGSADWARLAGALSAILHGRRDTSVLEGLSKIDTAIAGRALAALSGEVPVPSQLWPAIPFTGLISRVVNAAYGDRATADQLTPAFIRMGTDSDLAPMGSALRRILDGERAPGLARDLDPVSAAVVITILLHLPPV